MSSEFSIDKLPINENLDKFAPEYTPEVFTDEENKFLKPFFSNIDRPVFVTFGLPEEVNAALDSRYSRSTLSKRRLFLKEYVEPILHPENQKNWTELETDDQTKAIEMRDRFIEIVDFLNEKGSIDYVVNIQRARGFFETWLSGYGDDSIAEMGSGLHVSCEGVSNVVLEEVVSKRVGLSPLVKSTRYVRFNEKRPDGEYKYVVPGEIKNTSIEGEFHEVMDKLFDLYSELEPAYLDYIKEILPIGEDETEGSFNRSRGAKRFDDIRDLLPFATQINIGLAGNGRAYEDLINRLLASELGENRWLGQSICRELERIAPSFVKRPQTERGAIIQKYRSNIESLRKEMATALAPINNETRNRQADRWAKCISATPEAEVEILSTFLFEADSTTKLEEWRVIVNDMTPDERDIFLKLILDERREGKSEHSRDRDRFKKVPRAFENANYLMELFGRGGDMRDLHRHRQATEGHPPYTVSWGYDLERELKLSPFSKKVEEVLSQASKLYFKVQRQLGSEVAQYVVPFAFIQHWYMNLSAREIYWIGELRTGPQARSHYKEIVLQMVDEVSKLNPAIFQGVMVDRNDYRLSRRESEKKVDRN